MRPRAITGSVLVGAFGFAPGNDAVQRCWSIALCRCGREDRRAIIPRTSIAVLPFDDLTTGSEHDYFAGGLHGELLTQLARVSGLDPDQPQFSAWRMVATGEPSVRQISSELGVGTVVEASVQVLGNRLARARPVDRRANGQGHLVGELRSHDR